LFGSVRLVVSVNEDVGVEEAANRHASGARESRRG
jgi:hypothetical protein